MSWDTHKRVVSEKLKDLDEFAKGDSIYIKKSEGGYGYIYLCKFVKFEKGVVEGLVVEAEGAYPKFKVGERITARYTQCALWTFSPVTGSNSFHWFKKDTDGKVRIK